MNASHLDECVELPLECDPGPEPLLERRHDDLHARLAHLLLRADDGRPQLGGRSRRVLAAIVVLAAVGVGIGSYGCWDVDLSQETPFSRFSSTSLS